jgi:hypothetical protein
MCSCCVTEVAAQVIMTGGRQGVGVTKCSASVLAVVCGSWLLTEHSAASSVRCCC